MKKRTIIALLLTFLCLFLTNEFWIDYRPIPVSFNIQGSGDCDVKGTFDLGNHGNFANIKTQEQKINLDNNDFVLLEINKVKYPKKFRLTLFNINSSQIKLSDFRLRYGKVKLDKLDKFDISGADYKIVDNSLILTPKNEEIILTYNENLKLRCAIKIDFLFLVIIAVLSFLLLYKLTDYTADFKTLKNKSRIEIIFLSIFFVFLFVPMSYINQDKISPNENRTLAKWKPFIQDKQINYNFGKDFNEWFSDRFNLRQMMIQSYKSLTALAGVYSKGFYDKNSGMFYVDWEFERYNYDTIKLALKNLAQFNEWCEDNDIKLYTIITPQKSLIYEPTVNYYNFKTLKNSGNYINSLANEYNLRIIYPENELKSGAKDNYMFFKTEHHWTDDATFITYKLLMEEIKKDFPQVEPLKENDFEISYNNLVRAEWDRKFNYGSTCKKLGVSRKEKYHKVNYRYFTHKQSDKLETQIRHIKHHRDKTFYYPNGANLRILEIGNSQTENMTGFIPFTFKNVKHIRVNCVKGKKVSEDYKIMKYNSEEILEYKPDIMIFCFSYCMLPALTKLFDME